MNLESENDSPMVDPGKNRALDPALDLGPPDSRLWIFPLDSQLTASEQNSILARLGEFVGAWRAHGAPVSGKVRLIDDRFILVAADENLVHVSGCSNDALFRAVQTAAKEVGSDICDPGLIHFRDGSGSVCTVSRKEFKDLAAAGTIDRNTAVFDPTVSKVGQLQSSGFEKPLRESWHDKLLPQ